MIRKVLKTEEEVKEFLKDFGPNFAFDTETTGLKYMTLEIEGISLCDGKKACYIDLINNQDFSLIISLLKALFMETNTIIAHNIVFDMKVLHKYGISLEDKKIYDTMIADHLIDENRRHGLKYLAENILGKETLKYDEAEKAGHQSDLFYEYAINDAVWTWELCMYQQPIMKREGLVNVFRNIEMPFQFVLLDMQINGMLIDLSKVNEIRENLKESINNFQIELHDMIGERCEFQSDLMGNINILPTVNFNSGKVLQDILFNKLGLKVVESTPGGAPSTGRVTIDTYKKDIPFVATLNKYKIAQKLLSAYFADDGQIMRNLDSDGRVRPSFKDTGTKTGRLSCSDPNLQQLPKANEDFPIPSRSAFIAGPGRKMITADFSGQEVRVMAEISRDETLVDSLNKGYDMHLAVANKFYNLGIPIEALNDTHPDHDTYKSKFKKQRTQAKVITFGLAYGKGAFGFAKDFNISEEEAQKIVDDYFAGMPGLKKAIESKHEEVKQHGCVTYLSGRKRHFEKIQKEDWEGYSKKSLRQAFNACIQGYSADMMRLAMIKVREAFKNRPEMDFKLEATIHDELNGTVKQEYAEEAGKIVKECMETCVKFCVPVLADIDITDNYNDAK